MFLLKCRRGEMLLFTQVRGLSLQPDLQVTPKSSSQ